MSIVKGIALVTGSAQGIGRGIALRLARDGFDIALNDLPSKRDQLRAVSSEIENMGRRAHLVPANVTSEDDVKGMVRCIAKELGGLDVVSIPCRTHRISCSYHTPQMVANAGIGEVSDFLSSERHFWTSCNLVGCYGGS